MAQDWASDVKKFVPNADDEVIKGLVRYCGIALQKVDSSLVSYSDPVELGRVRENFLKKKLGLTQSDDVLDSAIAAVGERMKGDRTKNRVTVYYLLLEHLGLLHMFKKDGAPAAAAAPATGAAAAGLAAVGGAAAAAAGAVASGTSATVDAAKDVAADAAGAVASGVSATVDAAKDVGAGVAGVVAGGAAAVAGGAAALASDVKSAAAAPLGMASYGDDDGDKKGMGWLWWLLLGLLALGLLWWLFMRKAPEPAAVSTADTTMAAPVDATAPDANATAAVEAAPAAIPAGAGVVSETRDGKPLVKVFFDTGKADVVPAFTAAAGALKTYLADHAGSSLGVSGFNDPTGNAAANAALSKKRAEAVQAALVGTGIAAESIALVKPEASTDTTTSKDEARRVEVFIK